MVTTQLTFTHQQIKKKVKEEDHKAKDIGFRLFGSKTEETLKENSYNIVHLDLLADEQVKEEEFKADDNKLLLIDSTTEDKFKADGNYPAHFDSLSRQKFD